MRRFATICCIALLIAGCHTSSTVQEDSGDGEDPQDTGTTDSGTDSTGESDATSDGASADADDAAEDSGTGQDATSDSSGEDTLEEGFCTNHSSGFYCDGDDSVTCQSGSEVARETCSEGCSGGECEQSEVSCPTVPSSTSSSPPTEACNYMDWELSPDGFYLFSRFGTDADSTTWGSPSTCGYLQDYYTRKGCRHDRNAGTCLDDRSDIPHVQGHVDYEKTTMLSEIEQHLGSDVPHPEYFYVAGAQRLGCGATLRVSDLATGKCVVAYAEDGGPGTTYEMADQGGRRILDSSPGVLRYLGINDDCCWGSGNLVYVEWGKPGDVPGQSCTPCQSTPVQAGTENNVAPWDPEHMQPFTCR